MTEHDPFHDQAAAWALGALDDEEARRFADHLEGCGACRDEVARLQPVADALALSVPPAAAPPELRRSVMDAVRAEPEAPARRWLGAAGRRSAPRMLAPALAACAAVGVGVAIGVGVAGGGAPPARTVIATARAPGTPGARAVLVESGRHATLRVVGMPVPPSGRVYQAWLVHRGEPPTPDAVFTVDRRGRGSTALYGDPSRAAAVLVTTEPRGGSRVPTTPALIVVRPA